MKGSGARAIHYRLNSVFAGISEKVVQVELNKSKTHGREKPIFDGKAPLVPVTAQSVMDIHQIDLIDMSKHPCERNGITYRYILTLEDIFSRFIFLRALSNKEPTTVAEVLLPIYNSYGPPRILQCDQGNEFKGDLPILCSSFNIRMIRSRSRHPQSQGKVERSHRTIKSRLRFDEFSKLSETKGIEWVDSVPACEQLYNNTYHQAIKMSPFEAFFARQNNKFSRQPDIPNEKVGCVQWSVMLIYQILIQLIVISSEIEALILLL
ncbi:SCAN domain-containing protein 3-like [Saccoglossus kowalevskii]